MKYEFVSLLWKFQTNALNYLLQFIQVSLMRIIILFSLSLEKELPLENIPIQVF